MSNQTPQPMSFALLRNTHEVFRQSIVLMSELLDKGTLDDFRQEWRNFQRCRQTHLSMEEGAVFLLLDDVGNGAITEAGHDKEKCRQHLARAREYVKETYKFQGYGCGLCQVGVPCEAGIPVKAAREAIERGELPPPPPPLA